MVIGLRVGMGFILGSECCGSVEEDCTCLLELFWGVVDVFSFVFFRVKRSILGICVVFELGQTTDIW